MGTPFMAYFTMYFQETSNDFSVLLIEDFVLKHKVIFFSLLCGKGDTVFLYQKLCSEIIHLYADDLF